MKITTLGCFITTTLLSLSLLGCSDSSESKEPKSVDPEPSADTSYLDELAAKQGLSLEDDQAIDEYTTETDSTSEDAGDPLAGGEAESLSEDEQEREWVKERDSQSLYGRSRDKASNLRDTIQGSTAPGQGLADTLSEDEYASSSGLRWEMPEDWAMAIPPRGHFGEMYIKHPLGNASVSFSKESGSVRDLVRRMQRQMIDPMGGRSRARTTDKSIADLAVQIVDLEGTYLDPGSKGSTKEQIFYAMHAAIFDMGDSRILIKMWGPQDTVNQSTRVFDMMISDTSK